MAKQIGIDDLIHRIDNELIVLSEASQKGMYKYYDFKTALRMLNDLLQNEGYNEFRKRKVSELVNVFDDLCHTIVETVHIYDLAYDKDRKVRLSQNITYNSITHEKTVSPEYETDVPLELQRHYETLQLPIDGGHRFETTKIDYFLRTCNVDYSGIEARAFEADSNDDSIAGEITRWTRRGPRVLNKRDDFLRYFDLDINVVLKHKISFEEYVRRLVAERRIVENISDNLDVTLPVPDTEGHFSVNMSYKELQRILTALQQQGFVSEGTTIDTFYYRMTGNGAPTQERIIWVKKSSNRAINLASLIDFAVAMDVKLDEALSQINRIFCRSDNSDINLSDDTKTKSRRRNRLCQNLSIYHEEIMNIKSRRG